MTEDNPKFLVDLAFLNQIGSYLAERPYREVAPFMTFLAKLTPYKPEPAPQEPEPSPPSTPERKPEVDMTTAP